MIEGRIDIEKYREIVEIFDQCQQAIDDTAKQISINIIELLKHEVPVSESKVFEDAEIFGEALVNMGAIIALIDTDKSGHRVPQIVGYAEEVSSRIGEVRTVAGPLFKEICEQADLLATQVKDLAEVLNA